MSKGTHLYKYNSTDKFLFLYAFLFSAYYSPKTDIENNYF